MSKIAVVVQHNYHGYVKPGRIGILAQAERLEFREQGLSVQRKYKSRHGTGPAPQGERLVGRRTVCQKHCVVIQVAHNNSDGFSHWNERCRQCNSTGNIDAVSGAFNEVERNFKLVNGCGSIRPTYRDTDT